MGVLIATDHPLGVLKDLSNPLFNLRNLRIN
jgi:hypothetical protein